MPLFRKRSARKLSLETIILIGSLLIFILTIFFLEPPKSLNTDAPIQLLTFFISLILIISLSLNFLLKFYIKSLVISLGLIFLLVLAALNGLSINTGGLTILVILLTLKFFNKPKPKTLQKRSSKRKISRS